MAKRKKKSKKLSAPPAQSATKEIALAVLPKVAAWGAGIGFGYFFVLKPIFQKLGIIKTAEEKQNEQATTQNATSLTSAFSPRYYTTVTNATILTKASAESLAKTIYDAIGTFKDDENAVYGVFRQLKAKTQVSYLAAIFFTKYNADLYNYLERNLSSSEIGVVNNIVNGLK